MRRALWVPFAGLLAACADPSANTHDFAGDWTYTEVLSDIPKGLSCSATGVYHFNQAGTMVDGYYIQDGVCTTPSGPVSNADSSSVTMGRVVGRTIAFRASTICDYDGTLDLGSGVISGVGTCLIPRTSDTVHLIGNWSATR